jgi:hypothetical protein
VRCITTGEPLAYDEDGALGVGHESRIPAEGLGPRGLPFRVEKGSSCFGEDLARPAA